VADAENDEAAARLEEAGLLGRSILLGRTPRPGAALLLPRPINLLLVMRALDTIVGARPRAGTAPASATSPAPARRPPARPAPGRNGGRSVPPVDTTRSGRSIDSAPSARPIDSAPSAAGEATERQAPRGSDEPVAQPVAMTARARAPDSRPSRSEPHVQRVLDELAFRTATFPSNLDARALAAEAAAAARRSSPLARREPALARARSEGLPMEHILIADNDAHTLRLVAVQLQRFGFQMHLAGHPDDVVRLATSRFHDYVFMDPALPGLDALLVCRLVKQMPPPHDRPATTVVLLANPGAPPKLLERALPAADACLLKPLEQQALLKLMGEREVARVAYADTARTTTVI
jgi:CheY-like chemotaxis protein